MSEVLTIEEIQRRYDGEWVLIEDPQTDEALEVSGGTVTLHTPDRDEFDRQMVRERHQGRFAVLYVGEPPDEMEYVL